MSNPYEALIESTPDFPKPGVLFWDFTPLHEHPARFKQAIGEMKHYFSNKPFDKVVAVEAKGFITGSAFSYETQKPLVLARKPGLIPGVVEGETFIKEYGTGEYQMKRGAIKPGERVIILYDILAAAGATQAVINLVERVGGIVVGCAFVIELEYLKARESLHEYDLFSLVKISHKQPL